MVSQPFLRGQQTSFDLFTRPFLKNLNLQLSQIIPDYSRLLLIIADYFWSSLKKLAKFHFAQNPPLPGLSRVVGECFQKNPIKSPG